MKLWRPGITGKLFLAIFATCIVLLISMHWAVRISCERGFIAYIKRGNEQRLTMLGDALSEQYEQHGDWNFLRNNDRFIFQLLRTFERDNDERPPGGPGPHGEPGPMPGPGPRPDMPPHGWRTQFWVVDQQGRVLVGPRAPVPQDGTRRNIVVDGCWRRSNDWWKVPISWRRAISPPASRSPAGMNWAVWRRILTSLPVRLSVTNRCAAI